VSHEVGEDEPTVDEMDHVFLAIHQMDKVKVAAAIANANNRTMMFMRTKRGADRLVEQLGREGVRALAIHGDLRQGAREKALADFMAGKVKVLVATDVAARGVHVERRRRVPATRGRRQGVPPPLRRTAARRRRCRHAHAWNQENDIRIQRRPASHPGGRVFSTTRASRLAASRE
jgi:hypothetical protein